MNIQNASAFFFRRMWLNLCRFKLRQPLKGILVLSYGVGYRGVTEVNRDNTLHTLPRINANIKRDLAERKKYIRNSL
jgi:hypothetical protein